MNENTILPEEESCSLCGSLSPIFFQSKDQKFFNCPQCHGIFTSQYLLPNSKTEIDRYKTHNNDVNDPRYRKFVSPITNGIQIHFDKHHHGLDFGSGTGPVITKVLR